MLKCNLSFLKMSNKKKRRENTEHNFQNYLATCSLVFREWSILQMILPESCNIIIPNLQPMTIAIHLYLSTLEDVQRKYIALNLTEQVRQNSYTVPCPRPKQQWHWNYIPSRHTQAEYLRRLYACTHSGLWLISWIGHAPNLKHTCPSLAPRLHHVPASWSILFLARTCTCCVGNRKSRKLS